MWCQQQLRTERSRLSDTVSNVPLSAIVSVSSLEQRLLRTRLLIAIVVGACVGALIAVLVVGTLIPSHSATAYLRLHNPPDLSAIAGGATQNTPQSQDITDSFVAGEIAYLSGDGFAAAVGEKMAGDGPSQLDVLQESDSSVISVSATSGSANESIRTVQAAIDLYRAELAQRADELSRAIVPLLAQWQRGDAADPERVQQLQRLRESVELQASQASTMLVIQPPTASPNSSQWVVAAVTGALVGGACAAGLVLARRRRDGGGSVVETLADSVDGVLLPAIDLDRVGSHAGDHDARLRLARTLYAQCRSPGPGRTVLVLGVTTSSGGADVATLLESAAAEEAALGVAAGQHSTPVEAAQTHVVSGGAPGDPTLTPALLEQATDIILVTRLASDAIPDALALHGRLTASREVPVVAAFTYRHPLRGLFRGRR